MTRPDVRVCFLGDSYVNGTGDDDCLGWTGRLCAVARRAGHDVTYYNLGVRRETSADIARRWEAECAPRLLPSTQNHVVFSFGANDVTLIEGRRRVPEDDTVAHLRAMLVRALPRYRVLVVGPPPAGEPDHDARLARLSARMEETAVSLGVSYISTQPTLGGDSVWLDEVRASDGWHPGAAGYARLAAIVAASSAWWFRGA